MAKKKVFQISNALTEGLEETITAAHNYSGELRIEVIPIRKIDSDPNNPRQLKLTLTDMFEGISENDSDHIKKVEELADLQTLANSIRDQGIINPIVVYKYGERYRLVAGERRSLASVLAGKADIQAKILETKPSDLKVSLLQWIENVERSDLTLWERLRNLEKIAQVYAEKKGIFPDHITVTEWSNLIGCTKPHAINYKAVLNASPKLTLFIQENKIRNLEKAALIASREPTQQDSLMEACLKGTPLKKLRMLALLENRSKKERTLDLKKKSRGRQAESIQLGKTKNIKVVRLIIDALSQHTAASPLAAAMPCINWDDYKSINNAMKEILLRLEKLYV